LSKANSQAIGNSARAHRLTAGRQHRPPLNSQATKQPRLSAFDKSVSRKFEACAKLPYLLQCELPLFRQEHGDGAFGSKFRNQITLCEVLLFEEESHDRNCVRRRNG
jgi:hypothetical protein